MDLDKLLARGSQQCFHTEPLPPDPNYGDDESSKKSQLNEDKAERVSRKGVFHDAMPLTTCESSPQDDLPCNLAGTTQNPSEPCLEIKTPQVQPPTAPASALPGSPHKKRGSLLAECSNPGNANGDMSGRKDRLASLEEVQEMVRAAEQQAMPKAEEQEFGRGKRRRI